LGKTSIVYAPQITAELAPVFDETASVCVFGFNRSVPVNNLRQKQDSYGVWPAALEANELPPRRGHDVAFWAEINERFNLWC